MAFVCLLHLIDMIAIHGLDTDSSETWVWKPKPSGSGPPVNRLPDALMLPSRVGNASNLDVQQSSRSLLGAGRETIYY
jgi:hypothetical protein